MSEQLFVAGDFSGIQEYVLEVSAAGGGQARRLRARSFYVQLAAEVAVWRILQALGADGSAVPMSAGGHFLLCLPAGHGGPTALPVIREELSRALWNETRGQLSLSLCWGSVLEEVLRARDRAKRRPWAHVVTANGGWNPEAMSLPQIGEPCEICRRRSAERTLQHDAEKLRVCARCHDDTEIGRRLPQHSLVSLGGAGQFTVLGCGVWLGTAPPDAVRVPRPLHRHIPTDEDGQALTFERIAERAAGDDLLAVMKADVDDTGARLSALRCEDPSLAKTRRFSDDLDSFFSIRIQEEMSSVGKAWNDIYTIYSGGDDLLLVGPWNVVIDFAGWLRDAFQAGPGGRQGLGLTAGIALVPWRLPIRHAVEAADRLLERAKAAPNKNRCAALGSVWDWGRHAALLAQGKQLKEWIDSRVLPRTLAHRLLSILTRAALNRASLWAYQLARNLNTQRTAPVRQWADQVLNEIDRPGGVVLAEAAVALRYALIATRERRDRQ